MYERASSRGSLDLTGAVRSDLLRAMGALSLRTFDNRPISTAIVTIRSLGEIHLNTIGPAALLRRRTPRFRTLAPDLRLKRARNSGRTATPRLVLTGSPAAHFAR